jgi:hypothetical protein
MLRALPLTVLALGALAGLARDVRAASYGDYIDPTGTVQYLNVQDVNGLFGAPTVSLNSLDFTPTTFQAQCTQCPGGSTVSDVLTLDIQTIAGQRIDFIEVTEGLDYALQSFDAAGFASAVVTANIFIDVVQINGVNVNGINANASVLYSPANNVSIFGFDIESGVLSGTSGAIDVQQIIDNAGAFGEATRVRISLDNTLQVFHAGAGGSALIRKRDTDFVSLTVNGGNPIPEPSTAILLMGGLALLARRRPAD